MLIVTYVPPSTPSLVLPNFSVNICVVKEFSDTEVLVALNTLKNNNCTAGPDLVPSFAVRDCRSELVKSLLHTQFDAKKNLSEVLENMMYNTCF